MIGKLRKILIIPGLCIAILYSCHEQQKPAAPKAGPHTFSVKGSVREISIAPETVEFPDHEGKSEFISYCGICHSLKYVSSQPNFPRKTWEAEVNKMILKYHAPVDSANGKKIVDYLVAVKSDQQVSK